MPMLIGQLPIDEALMPILRLSLWLVILVMVFVPLERLFAIHPQNILRKEIANDLGYYFLNSLVPAMILSVPAAALAWAVHRVIPDGFLAWAGSLPLWARIVIGLVAGEVGYYWGHRLSHEIPFLWRFHAIHHSAEQMDFLVNTRAHPLDMVFSRFCGLVPVYALGLGGPAGPSGSTVPVIVTLISTTWGFFIHSNVRWRFGPLEWLISTPAFHHWHHTLDGPVNRNYSSTLPWIDWIFRTHHMPRNQWPKSYGIEDRLPESLAGQLIYPLTTQPLASTREESLPARRADLAVPEAANTGTPGATVSAQPRQTANTPPDAPR
ncbi:MAG: sterol desaturase family protein [Phycisphaerales bacterium]|nr:sterol desaturase family protein [Phycisphaerales bacterium]